MTQRKNILPQLPEMQNITRKNMFHSCGDTFEETSQTQTIPIYKQRPKHEAKFTKINKHIKRAARSTKFETCINALRLSRGLYATADKKLNTENDRTIASVPFSHSPDNNALDSIQCVSSTLNHEHRGTVSISLQNINS